MRSGDWTADDLREFLLQISETLAEKGLACRTFIEESGYRSEAEEEVDEGLSGIEHYEYGMQEMWQFLDDGDLAHLAAGLKIIWEGNEKINQAMRLNRESREDLDLSFLI